jgi:hypothetical protein
MPPTTNMTFQSAKQRYVPRRDVRRARQAYRSVQLFGCRH